jgi:hypothetical protein
MTARRCHRDEPVTDISLQLRGKLSAALLAEAKRRKRDPADLLADVIEAVIADNLFAAVLET